MMWGGGKRHLAACTRSLDDSTLHFGSERGRRHAAHVFATRNVDWERLIEPSSTRRLRYDIFESLVFPSIIIIAYYMRRLCYCVYGGLRRLRLLLISQSVRPQANFEKRIK